MIRLQDIIPDLDENDQTINVKLCLDAAIKNQENTLGELNHSAPIDAKIRKELLKMSDMEKAEIYKFMREMKRSKDESDLSDNSVDGSSDDGSDNVDENSKTKDKSDNSESNDVLRNTRDCGSMYDDEQSSNKKQCTRDTSEESRHEESLPINFTSKKANTK